MSGVVEVDGHKIEVDDDATVADLKETMGVDENYVAVYRDGDVLKPLSDEDRLSEKVPDGATISSEPFSGKCLLRNVDFPKGWCPKRGAILYKLPKAYPKSPASTYVPSKMRYHGSVPKHMMARVHAFSKDDGWSKCCIRNLDWSPKRHTLTTMTRWLMTSLSQPNKDLVV